MRKKYYIYRIRMFTTNILSIIILLLTCFLAYKINSKMFMNSVMYFYHLSFKGFILFIGTYIFYMMLHEILHSLAYVIMGAKFKNIVYGASLENGILYCLCKQNITKKNILISLMTPFILIGILTFIIAFKIESPLLLLLSMANISGCAGDIIMFLFICKLKNIEFTEFDDPISFAIYTNKNIEDVSHFGLIYEDEATSLEKNNLRKINVSMFTIVFLIIFLIFFFFTLHK